MKGFKDSSFGRNVIEGLAIFIILFPIFAIWIAGKERVSMLQGLCLRQLSILLFR
jgi:hypothetical protein